MHIGCIAVPSVNKVCGGVTTESTQNLLLNMLDLSLTLHILFYVKIKKIKSFA